jgi:hypothetical protein
MFTIFGMLQCLRQVLSQQTDGEAFSVPIAHTTCTSCTPDCTMNGLGTSIVALSTPTGTVAVMLIAGVLDERFHDVSIIPRAEAYRPVAELGPK